MIAEDGIDALNAWLSKAGLRSEPEAALVSGFCERAVAAGLPLSLANLTIWGHLPGANPGTQQTPGECFRLTPNNFLFEQHFRASRRACGGKLVGRPTTLGGVGGCLCGCHTRRCRRSIPCNQLQTWAIREKAGVNAVASKHRRDAPAPTASLVHPADGQVAQSIPG
jgi:hypothetical protein